MYSLGSDLLVLLILLLLSHQLPLPILLLQPLLLDRLLDPQRPPHELLPIHQHCLPIIIFILERDISNAFALTSHFVFDDPDVLYVFIGEEPSEILVFYIEPQVPYEDTVVVVLLLFEGQVYSQHSPIQFLSIMFQTLFCSFSSLEENITVLSIFVFYELLQNHFGFLGHFALAGCRKVTFPDSFNFSELSKYFLYFLFAG